MDTPIGTGDRKRFGGAVILEDTEPRLIPVNENPHSLLTPQDFEPLSPRALYSRMQQSLAALPALVDTASIKSTVDELRTGLNALDESNLNVDALKAIRDKFVSFFDGPFENLVRDSLKVLDGDAMADVQRWGQAIGFSQRYEQEADVYHRINSTLSSCNSRIAAENSRHSEVPNTAAFLFRPYQDDPREIMVLSISGGSRHQKILSTVVDQMQSFVEPFLIVAPPIRGEAKVLSWSPGSTDAEDKAMSFVDGIMKGFPKDQKTKVGGLWGACGAPPTATTVMAVNSLSERHPDLKVAIMSHTRTVHINELKNWDLETELKNQGREMVIKNSDGTAQVGMTWYAEVMQKRREACVELSNQLATLKNERVLPGNIEFLRLDELAKFSGTVRNRKTDDGFRYVELEGKDSKGLKYFVRARHDEFKKLGIDPKNKVAYPPSQVKPKPKL